MCKEEKKWAYLFPSPGFKLEQVCISLQHQFSVHLFTWKTCELKAGGHLIFLFTSRFSLLPNISCKVCVNFKHDELGVATVSLKCLYRDNKEIVKICFRKSWRHFQVINAMCGNLKSALLFLFVCFIN